MSLFPGRSNLRGSLPNVSRLVPHTQHHNSDSSLADHQYDDQYSSPDPRYNRYSNSDSSLADHQYDDQYSSPDPRYNRYSNSDSS